MDFGPYLLLASLEGAVGAAVLALTAVGLSLVFGVMRVVNVAHGEFYMIGAVVGVQPFGGEGLSGTGPKAGGPRYLYRFATERSLSIDTTAAGGNASLMSLDEEMPV